MSPCYNRLVIRARATLSLLAVLGGACFDTSITRHLPCTGSEQCGLGQSCNAGFCDGPPADFDPTAYCGDEIAQDGELCWEPGARYGSGALPASVIVARIDGDDVLDVVVANENVGSVSVLLGLGDGTLAEADTTMVGNGPVSLAAGDLDGDGSSEIAAATGSEVVLLRASGGSFAFETLSLPAGVVDPVAVAMGDIDGDDAIDLVIASASDRSVTVALNDGSGTLVAGEPFLTMGEPRPDGMTLGAIAESGALPGALLGTAAGLELLAGVGDGTLETPQVYALEGSAGVGTAFGLLNGQPGFDAIVAIEATDTIAILPGIAAGDILNTPPIPTMLGVAPRAIALADLDGNDTTDIVVADPDSGLWILATDPTDEFAPRLRDPVLLGSTQAPYDVAVGDLDADGRQDLVTADRGASGVSVYLSSL
jgi:hypothetical protein